MYAGLQKRRLTNVPALNDISTGVEHPSYVLRVDGNGKVWVDVSIYLGNVFASSVANVFNVARYGVVQVTATVRVVRVVVVRVQFVGTPHEQPLSCRYLSWLDHRWHDDTLSARQRPVLNWSCYTLQSSTQCGTHA